MKFRINQDFMTWYLIFFNRCIPFKQMSTKEKIHDLFIITLTTRQTYCNFCYLLEKNWDKSRIQIIVLYVKFSFEKIKIRFMCIKFITNTTNSYLMWHDIYLKYHLSVSECIWLIAVIIKLSAGSSFMTIYYIVQV